MKHNALCACGHVYEIHEDFGGACEEDDCDCSHFKGVHGVDEEDD